MKNIAILTSRFPVLSETFVGNEMRAMNAYGHSVLPIAMYHSSDSGQIDDLPLVEQAKYLCDAPRNVPLSILKILGTGLIKCLPFVFRQRGLAKKSLYWNGLRLALILKKEKIQHIHAHFSHGTAAHAIVAARMANITVSFVGHGSDIYVNPVDLPVKLAASDFNVAVCKEMQDEFTKWVNLEKVKHISCGIDPEKFKPQQSDQKHNGKLLYIGRLSESKGVDLIIKALAKIAPETRPSIDIVGDGVLRDELFNLTANLKLDDYVNYLGAKGANWIVKNAPEYLAFVSPFKPAANGARDTGPLVIKEAMAMGLPIISSSFMGVKDMVTEETGILIKVGDVAALAESIIRMYQMPEAKRYAMGQAGRKRILSCYTTTKQAQELSKWIESV